MFLIHSADIPPEYLERLNAILPELTCVPVRRSKDVYASIASHPDIFIFAIDHNTLIVSPSIHEELSVALARSGVRLIRARSIPQGIYPDTAILNAVRIGPYILHNTQCTDAVIRDLARKRSLEIVHVNQGYTRCSVVNVNSGAIITSDAGIADTARKLGIDVMTVSAGSVMLPGERTGFIGGTCGRAPDGKIVFLGDLKRHPDHAAIDIFFRRHQIEYLCLPDLPLYDAGSLILLPSGA